VVISVFYAPRALADIERLADFLLTQDEVAAKETSEILIEAIAHLARHPLVGRIVEHGLRELVISRGRTGYVALYRFDADRNHVIVLAIKHQRELDIAGKDHFL
jgi:plasmid stabilization system protein ParE